MEKKISKGVVSFGILHIVYYSFFMLQYNLEDARYLLQPLPEGIILSDFFITKAILVLGVISGIGILRLKNVFRKTALFVGFYTIISYLSIVSFIESNNVLGFLEKKAAYLISTAPHISESAASTILWTSVIIGDAIHLIFTFGLIYFFTRPKVKEQFK